MSGSIFQGKFLFLPPTNVAVAGVEYILRTRKVPGSYLRSVTENPR